MTAPESTPTGPAALAGVLRPDEELLSATSMPKRRATGCRVVTQLMVIGVFTVVLGGLITIGVAVLRPGAAQHATEGPFRDVGTVFPIAAAVVAGVLLLLNRRSLLVAAPPRVHAVTSRRAMVVVETRKGSEVRDEIPLEALTSLTRSEQDGRRDVLWRVRITRSRNSSDSYSQRRVERFGFTDVPDTRAAEASLMAPFAPPATDIPMMGPPVVPGPTRALLDATLHPGETLRWAAHAEASAAAKKWFVPATLAVAGVFVVIYGWLMTMAWPSPRNTQNPLAWVFVGFLTFLMVMMGLGLLAALRRFRAQQVEGAAYAVTDRRALIVQRDGNGALRVDSYLPQAVRRAESEQTPRGTTVRFTAEKRLPIDSLILTDRFTEVADGDGLRAALASLG